MIHIVFVPGRLRLTAPLRPGEKTLTNQLLNYPGWEQP